MSKRIASSRANVKSEKRYSQRKDALGRTYTIDRKTGKRVANELAKRERQQTNAQKRELKRLAKEREAIAKERAKLERERKKLERKRAMPKHKPLSDFKRRSAASKLGWKRKKEREAKEKEAAPTIAPDMPSRRRVGPVSYMAEPEAKLPEETPSEEFVPVQTLEAFRPAETLKERAIRYEKVGKAVMNALEYAERERLEIQRRFESGDTRIGEGELIRFRLARAFLGEDEQFSDFEEAAAYYEEESGLDAYEVYEYFFSPEVA